MVYGHMLHRVTQAASAPQACGRNEHAMAKLPTFRQTVFLPPADSHLRQTHGLGPGVAELAQKDTCKLLRTKIAQGPQIQEFQRGTDPELRCRQRERGGLADD